MERKEGVFPVIKLDSTKNQIYDWSMQIYTSIFRPLLNTRAGIASTRMSRTMLVKGPNIVLGMMNTPDWTNWNVNAIKLNGEEYRTTIQVQAGFTRSCFFFLTGPCIRLLFSPGSQALSSKFRCRPQEVDTANDYFLCWRMGRLHCLSP